MPCARVEQIARKNECFLFMRLHISNKLNSEHTTGKKTWRGRERTTNKIIASVCWKCNCCWYKCCSSGAFYGLVNFPLILFHSFTTLFSSMSACFCGYFCWFGLFFVAFFVLFYSVFCSFRFPLLLAPLSPTLFLLIAKFRFGVSYIRQEWNVIKPLTNWQHISNAGILL